MVVRTSIFYNIFPKLHDDCLIPTNNLELRIQLDIQYSNIRPNLHSSHDTLIMWHFLGHSSHSSVAPPFISSAASIVPCPVGRVMVSSSFHSITSMCNGNIDDIDASPHVECVNGFGKYSILSRAYTLARWHMLEFMVVNITQYTQRIDKWISAILVRCKVFKRSIGRVFENRQTTVHYRRDYDSRIRIRHVRT